MVYAYDLHRYLFVFFGGVSLPFSGCVCGCVFWGRGYFGLGFGRFRVKGGPDPCFWGFCFFLGVEYFFVIFLFGLGLEGLGWC